MAGTATRPVPAALLALARALAVAAALLEVLGMRVRLAFPAPSVGMRVRE
ncbi:MAG: hypothetical protein BroJett026_22850 [Betaproteobacteria bacterium]|nr:MAG: hypothetical protein BroJett026_22850 [Betaproteobacteria bacterium]